MISPQKQQQCEMQEAPLYNGEDLKTFTFPPKFDHRKSGVPGNPCFNFRFRIFTFFTFIVVTQIGQIFYTPKIHVNEIYDAGHNLTSGVNYLYHTHKWFASLIQILSGVILDFTFFYISIYWVLYTRNFRLFASLIIFYGVRAIHLNFQTLPANPTYYWEDPGVPSLVVKYGFTSDFFYSGHVGFLMIGSLEMRKVGQKWMALIFFCCSIYQAFVVISFNIHYTVDVSAGYVFAHYFFNMVCYWEVKIDYNMKRIADMLRCKKKTIRIENEADIEKGQPMREN